MSFAVSCLILGLDGFSRSTQNGELPIRSSCCVLLIVRDVVQGPTNGKANQYEDSRKSRELDRVRGEILSLQSPQMRHHDSEAKDAVEREAFMGTIEGFKESDPQWLDNKHSSTCWSCPVVWLTDLQGESILQR